MQPKVSVIIPVFNTAGSAIKLVISLLKGPYKNLEFILVNDGSTDDSYRLLKEFVRQFNIMKNKAKTPTIKLLNEENMGPSAARNYGLDEATGEYVAFVDSDDAVSKLFIKKLYLALTKYDNYESSEVRAGLSSCGYKYYRVSKKAKTNLFTNEIPERYPDEEFKTYILRLIATDGRLYACHNKLYRRNIIEKYKLRFDEKMNFAEDTKFVLQYLKAANREKYSRIAFVNEPLYQYNFGTESSIVSNSSLSWGNWRKSYQFLEAWLGNNPSKTDVKFMRKIYGRWKLSHALAVARSNQSFGHKCNHVSPALLIPATIVVKFRH